MCVMAEHSMGLLNTSALLGLSKEKPINVFNVFLWGWGIDSSVCSLLRYVSLSINVLIVCFITPLCHSSGTLQSFSF